MKKEEFFLTCRFLGEQLAQTPCCSRLPSPDHGDDDDDDDDDDDNDNDGFLNILFVQNVDSEWKLGEIMMTFEIVFANLKLKCKFLSSPFHCCYWPSKE